LAEIIDKLKRVQFMSIFEKKGFIKMLMHNKRDFDAAAARWDEKPRRVRLAEDILQP